MTKKEAAIISAYTGILIGDMEDYHRYIEIILGRPVFTAEIPKLQNEIKSLAKKDFCNIKITDTTRIDER